MSADERLCEPLVKKFGVVGPTDLEGESSFYDKVQQHLPCKTNNLRVDESILTKHGDIIFTGSPNKDFCAFSTPSKEQIDAVVNECVHIAHTNASTPSRRPPTPSSRAATPSPTAPTPSRSLDGGP